MQGSSLDVLFFTLLIKGHRQAAQGNQRNDVQEEPGPVRTALRQRAVREVQENQLQSQAL